MAQLTLILGGVRSGKSRFAEELAARHLPVIYLATAQAGDEEMAERIARHRHRRPPQWRTIEEPWDVAGVVAAQATTGCVLIECLTFWLTNQLLGLPGRPAREAATILAEVDALAVAAQQARGRVVVVSNEVGCGVVPANDLGRRFGDLLGEANQCLAAAATEVHVCVAGIPLRIK
jgi:adenosylcobinamide kinase/adenosylcobinamide-phosphate guanylyltransferase